MHFFLNVKAHFHARKFSTDRKSSENIIVKSWKFSLQNIFSDKKFVSANHILQIFLSAENFLEWKWALITVIHPSRKYSRGYRAFKSSVTDDIIINRSFIFTDITGWFRKCITCNTKGYEPNISITKQWRNYYGLRPWEPGGRQPQWAKWGPPGLGDRAKTLARASDMLQCRFLTIRIL
jgi:hypothetical protein